MKSVVKFQYHKIYCFTTNKDYNYYTSVAPLSLNFLNKKKNIYIYIYNYYTKKNHHTPLESHDSY